MVQVTGNVEHVHRAVAVGGHEVAATRAPYLQACGGPKAGELVVGVEEKLERRGGLLAERQRAGNGQQRGIPKRVGPAERFLGTATGRHNRVPDEELLGADALVAEHNESVWRANRRLTVEVAAECRGRRGRCRGRDS